MPAPVELFDTAGRARHVILVVLLLFLAAWRGPGTIRGLMPAADNPMDFFEDWASGRNRLTGRPVYESQRVTQQLYLGLDAAQTRDILIEVNAHPPTSVVLVLPLAWLAYRAAMLAWNLLSLALLAACVWLVLSTLGVKLSGWSWTPLAALLLLSNPFRQQVNQGQLNCVLLALLTGSWFLYRHGRTSAAAALAGVAAAVKLFPVFMLVWFVARRDWRAVLAGGLALAAALGLTVAVLGIEPCLYYARVVVPKVGEWRSAWINASIPGFCAKLFSPRSLGGQMVPLVRSTALATVATGIGSLLVTLVVWQQARRARSRAAIDHAFGLATVGMLLVSPITWDHYFLLLLLPATLVWLARPASLLGRAALVLLFATLWIGPDWFWYILIGTRWAEPIVARPWQTLTALSFQFYALAGLFLVGARLLAQPGPVPADPAPGRA